MPSRRNSGGAMPPSSTPLLVMCGCLMLGNLRFASSLSMEESQEPAGPANAKRRVSHVHPTPYPTRYTAPAPTAGVTMASSNATDPKADSIVEFLFLGKNVTSTGSSSSNVTSSGNVTSSSNSTDDGITEDQELLSTPPPEYTAAPLLPSCSRPPAWADDDMFWSKLSDDQRNAALFLGYTSTAWDADDDTIIEELYAMLDWSSGLSSDQRLAFTYLGYNSGSYENFYDDYSFAELPADVQTAANAVGYTQKVWDECDEEVCAKVDDKFWKGLKKGERINMKVLGYDCWTWNNYEPAPCV